MDLRTDLQFRLNGQTIYPRQIAGQVVGYAIKGREHETIQWADLKAVTRYIRDKALGRTPPELS